MTARIPCFTLRERLALVKQCVKHLPNVEADSFDGLLVDYVEKRGGAGHHPRIAGRVGL